MEWENDCFSIEWDMKYLLAWLSRLKKSETEVLLELSECQNSRAYQILKQYLRLVQAEDIDVNKTTEEENKLVKISVPVTLQKTE